jgi:hypothetical protein
MTAEARYKKLEPARNHWIDRGRKAGALTLPWLLPSDGEPQPQSMEEIQHPWDGIGQRGVHNIASRLLLALLPPTESFFRFVHDDMEFARQQAQLAAEGMPAERIAELKTQIDKTLGLMERAVLRSIETSSDRTALHEALLHLIVAGNCMVYVPEDGCKTFNLYRYVLRRCPMGKPLEAVVCERMAAEELPKAAKEILDKADPLEPLTEKRYDNTLAWRDEDEIERTVKVYTHIRWEKDKCRWHQEIKGHRIEGSEGRAPRDVAPWIPLRMFRIDAEDYSPGYVEAACMADLQTANALTRALTEGALVSAMVKFLAKPGAAVTAKQFNEAANGACLTGNPEDITAVQVGKGSDLAVAEQRLQRVQARLATAFMLTDVRDSERTTAEEVRLQAQQIENSLGSVYSILTTEFQYPYISRKLHLLTKAGGLPPLPDDSIKPVVSVGLAAVGRGNDLERHARFMQILQQTLPPEVVVQMMFPNELVSRLAAAMGIDTVGLIKTQQQIEEEQAAAQQAAQQQALLQSPAADPQKLATAAATVQDMQQPTEEPAQ